MTKRIGVKDSMYDDFNIDEVYTETALSDSFIYGEFNRNSEFLSLVMNAMKKSKVITEEYISEQIAQIERTRLSPLVSKVLQAYRDGDIMIMHGDKDVRVPQSIPFLVTKIQGKVKSIIFTHNYGKIGKAEASGIRHLDISYKDLYTLMESAYVAHNYHVYNNRLSKNLGLMKVTCSLYTNMITRIFNKAYSIMNEFELYDKVVFCIGKFYLERVWTSTNAEVNFSYALSNVKSTNGGRGVNVYDIQSINDEYDAAKIASIDDLIKFISDLSPRFKGISTRIFFQTYINTYKTASVFGMEVLPYFFFVIEASIIGSYIVNRDLIMDIMKITKGMNIFYPELSKAIV